jgi:hypothetical protein
VADHLEVGVVVGVGWAEGVAIQSVLAFHALTAASGAMVSAVLGGSEVSGKTALTLVVLTTKSRMSRPESSAELSKLGMIEPTN